MRVTQPTENRYLKALVFGPPGQGKTRFLGTAQQDERTSPMLLLDFEGGTQTLVGLDIDIVRIRDWADYNAVYDELVEGNSKYKSLGIDSVSETLIFTLLDILDADSANRRDPNLLQQQDYGKAQIQMRRLLRSFRDLPLHVFYTALSKEIVEARVGSVKVPALSGQLAEEIPGMLDVVGYLALSREVDPKTQQVTETRSLLLKGFSQFRVKVRTGWDVEIPDFIDNPTVSKLMDELGFDYPSTKVVKQLVERDTAKAG